MFPGTSGAEHAAREAGLANRSTRRNIMHIPNVLTQFADGIATWTINRQDKHNALDSATIEALLDLRDDAEDERAVRASRTEERKGGTQGVSTCKRGWLRDHKKK